MTLNSIQVLTLSNSQPVFRQLPLAVPAVIAFCLDTKKLEATALGLAGSQEKAGSCPNKMLALYNPSHLKFMLRIVRIHLTFAFNAFPSITYLRIKSETQRLVLLDNSVLNHSEWT
jgi:hypothetical protein